MPTKYHNLSNEALADEIGRVDAIAKYETQVVSTIIRVRPVLQSLDALLAA